MITWQDTFTGVNYQISDAWAQQVRRHLADLLLPKLQDFSAADGKAQTIRQAANVCARFWHDYYALVFPLRFGKRVEGNQSISGAILWTDEDTIRLEQDQAQSLRQSFLDTMSLPPLLTAETNPKELIADHHLTCAAVTNVILRAHESMDKKDAKLFHSLRLGILLHELSAEEQLSNWLRPFTVAWQIARALCGDGEFPTGVDRALIQSVHEGQLVGLDQPKVYVIGAGVQRIKQFVFESPGLNEIRGASTLLDRCVTHLQKRVSIELGSEVVFRAAASTIEFLAPSETDERGHLWTEELREFFYRRTGTAFVAAAACQVTPRALLANFDTVMQGLHNESDRDRYRADTPVIESLPFESRCNLCRTRPAEGWYKDPEHLPALVCRICITKRKLGKLQRIGKSREILRWLQLDDPKVLRVQAAPDEDPLPYDLSQLSPAHAVRKRVAVIYGDGNNFGRVISQLSSLALSLQWTHRVERTTQAAVALALAHATQKAGEEKQTTLTKLPFQVLALGGDDLSLFTWGRIGLRVCEQFVKLTDIEFQSSSNFPRNQARISFSLGALFCDEKTPVRRSVDFTEQELLKWAKRTTAVKPTDKEQGHVAHLLALTAEQIPADLDAYRDTMFLRAEQLCLTLRPFTADELAFLLAKATALLKSEHSGRLQRMVEAFIKTRPFAAILHYLYQKQREQNAQQGFIQLLEEPRLEWQQQLGIWPLPAAILPQRTLYGEELGTNENRDYWFSPLWDLQEMVKILE